MYKFPFVDGYIRQEQRKSKSVTFRVIVKSLIHNVTSVQLHINKSYHNWLYINVMWKWCDRLIVKKKIFAPVWTKNKFLKKYANDYKVVKVI